MSGRKSSLMRPSESEILFFFRLLSTFKSSNSVKSSHFSLFRDFRKQIHFLLIHLFEFWFNYSVFHAFFKSVFVKRLKVCMICYKFCIFILLSYWNICFIFPNFFFSSHIFKQFRLSVSSMHLDEFPIGSYRKVKILMCMQKISQI